MITGILITSLVFGFAVVVYRVSKRGFDDTDPDMCHDTFAPPSKGTEALTDCTHPEKTDVVVQTATTCEDVWTICDICSEVLSKRTDC